MFFYSNIIRLFWQLFAHKGYNKKAKSKLFRLHWKFSIFYIQVKIVLIVDWDPALSFRTDRVSLHCYKMQTWKYNKVMFVHLNWFFFKLNINVSSKIQRDRILYLSNMNISFSFIFGMSKKLICLKIYYEN